MLLTVVFLGIAEVPSWGCFTRNLGPFSVIESEILGYILKFKHAAQKGWLNIWLESDSTSALQTFKNTVMVPIRICNR
jgi:hypothetical protein